MQRKNTHASGNKHPKGAFIEGKHAVQEALEAGVPLLSIMVADTLQGAGDEAHIRSSAQREGIPVKSVRRSVLDALSKRGNHQGIMAEAKPFVYETIDTLIAAASGKDQALIVALDHITDAGNMGAIIRSVEVVGAIGLLIPNKRNAQVNTTAYKASAGATAHLPIAREANLVGSLKRLKEEGFWIAGASEKATENVWQAPLEGRIVLVMGSEDEGLSRLVSDTCDFLVALPQVGQIASLNVAQATTAIAYEWLRRGQQKDEA